MKCIFINCINYDFPEKEVIPLGLLSLATIIDDYYTDVTACVIDLNYVYSNNKLILSNDLYDNINNTTAYILNESPDFISLYTMCSTHHFAILLTEKLKKQKPNLVICLAGPHATVTAKETLSNYGNYIDFIGLGEGESTIISIINGIKKNNLCNIQGIAYKNDKEVTINYCENNIDNLDSLPILKYELLNFEIKGKVSIDVGRGCPFSCIFCSTKNFWKNNFRIKTANRIFNEICNLYYNYNIREFSFEHDLFTYKRVLIMELCKLIINTNLKITWSCSSRIDTIDNDLIKIMSTAGCKNIYFGIETGSQNMQYYIKKNIKLHKVWDIIPELQKYNIQPTFSFIYGFPDETLDDLEKTLIMYYQIYQKYKKFNKTNKAYIQLHKLVVYPGTELNEMNTYKLVQHHYRRADIQKSINDWNNDYILEIINNENIFPHFFEIDKISKNNLNVLDIFYGHMFHYFIEYLDKTYEYLLKYFKYHYNVYYSIVNFVGIDEINRTLPNINNTVLDIILLIMNIFKNYILNNNFNEYDLLIKNMFSFEINIFELLHNKNINYNKLIEYDYDVLNMKKYEAKVIKKKTIIEFIINNNKRIIKKSNIISEDDIKRKFDVL